MMILQRMEGGLSAGLLPAGCSLVISLVGFWQGITVLMCCRDMSGCFCGIYHQLKLIFLICRVIFWELSSFGNVLMISRFFLWDSSPVMRRIDKH